MLCNFLVWIKSFFGHENIKKLTKGISTYGSLDFFSLSAASNAQNRPELNICFINSCIQLSVVLYLGTQANTAALSGCQIQSNCRPKLTDLQNI